MFHLFIGLADCSITIGSGTNPNGLLVIFDPSHTIPIIPIRFLHILYPLPSLEKKNIVPRSPTFVRPCITSISLQLHSPATPDIFTHTSTSIYFVPPHYTAFTLIYTTFYRYCSNLARSFITYIALLMQTYTLITQHYPTII